MERDIKLFLGKILGEIYRLQKSPERATTYGLIKGIEPVVDEELESLGLITADQLRHVEEVLEKIDKDKNSKFSGFYDIEGELKEGGVDRSQAIVIIKYLKAHEQFLDVIDKMNGSNSPSECRTFQIRDIE